MAGPSAGSARSSDAGSPTTTNMSSKWSPSIASSQGSSSGALRRASTSTTGSGRIITKPRDSVSEELLQSDLALLRAAMYENPTPCQSPDSIVQTRPLVMPTTTQIDLILWYPANWQSSIQTLLSHYATILAPRLPFFNSEQGFATLHDVWIPFLLSSQITINATLLLASTHYSGMYGQQPPLLDADTLKSMTLSEITSAITSDANKPSNELIAAVMLLAQYEAFVSNAQTFHLHMTGLRRLVNARGDLKTTGVDGLVREMLIWLIRESGFNQTQRPTPSPSPSPG
ncbi:Hypothetical protein D9617_16g013770 [Elsinoe fawcettii]|nr:Hypothetical protein D9617_16g013770 [Elsinoe fawcettii]